LVKVLIQPFQNECRVEFNPDHGHLLWQRLWRKHDESLFRGEENLHFRNLVPTRKLQNQGRIGSGSDWLNDREPVDELTGVVTQKLSLVNDNPD
jgi:hypothetical protein